MDTSNILRFVAEWTANNSESWFTSHAEEFLQIKEDLGRLAVQLNLGIRAFDPNIMLLRPKDMLRDIFPTHPTLQIHIAPEGMRPIPVGYFLCIRPGNRSFLSGGLYSSMFGTASDMVRRYIIKDPLAWSALLDEPSFRERFVVLGTPLAEISGRLRSQASPRKVSPAKQLVCTLPHSGRNPDDTRYAGIRSIGDLCSHVQLYKVSEPCHEGLPDAGLKTGKNRRPIRDAGFFHTYFRYAKQRRRPFWWQYERSLRSRSRQWA